MSLDPRADEFIPPTLADLAIALERAFAFAPATDEATRMDARVARAIAVPRVAGRRFGRPKHLTRYGLIAAALLVLGGGTGSLLGLYGSIGGGGYTVAWDRSTKLALTQVDQGYQVTLEAAYADAAQTMLAISVLDTEVGRSDQLDLRGAELTDEAGRTYRMTGGGSTPAEASVSANTVWYDTPGDGSLSGKHHFFLAVDEIGVRDGKALSSTDDPWHTVAGRWKFEFDLAIASGTLLTPGTIATANGVTATLDSILMTPTTVRVDVSYRGLPAGASAWASVASVQHAGQTLPIGAGGSSGSEVVQDTINTVIGTDTTAGSWTVRIDELVGEGADGQVRLTGPWTFSFSAP